MQCEGRTVGNKLSGPLSKLSPTPEEIAWCAHVWLCRCHLRSGRGFRHIDHSVLSEFQHAVAVTLIVHSRQNPTGRMAFLRLCNHGGGSRYFDGQDRMYTCRMQLCLDDRGDLFVPWMLLLRLKTFYFWSWGFSNVFCIYFHCSSTVIHFSCWLQLQFDPHIVMHHWFALGSRFTCSNTF